MSVNRGKQFENKLAEDFKRIPNCFIYRLHDQVSGNKTTSQNPCDFIVYMNPSLFLIEVKTISGNTFPINNFIQFERLQRYKGIKGVYRGVIIWFTEKEKIIYVPVKTIEKMLTDGKKSVNIRTIDEDGYEYIEIPSIKKRVFLDSDYSVLLDLPQGW